MSIPCLCFMRRNAGSRFLLLSRKVSWPPNVSDPDRLHLIRSIASSCLTLCLLSSSMDRPINIPIRSRVRAPKDSAKPMMTGRYSTALPCDWKPTMTGNVRSWYSIKPILPSTCSCARLFAASVWRSRGKSRGWILKCAISLQVVSASATIGGPSTDIFAA